MVKISKPNKKSVEVLTARNVNTRNPLECWQYDDCVMFEIAGETANLSRSDVRELIAFIQSGEPKPKK